LSASDVSLVGAARRACNLRVIAINDTYALAPWADVLYAPDEKWWGWHGDHVSRVYHGLKYTLATDGPAEAAGALRLNFRSGGGLTDDPTTVMTGGHSGPQAINLSVHLGAARVVLLGYDLQAAPSNGSDHYFGAHPDCSRVPYESQRDVYTSLVAPLHAQGITIVNATRATAITAIPRVRLEDVLCTPWYP